MSDLISRQSVELRINEFFTNETYTEGMLRDDIHNLPSAEPEIIRCKDCKYWEESFPFDLCMLTKAKNNIWRSDETDFCSWAERREE